MIPRPLVRARLYKGVIKPGYVDPEDADRLGLATRLRELYRDHLGAPRWRLDEGVEAELELCADVQLGRGLARVLEDRTTFRSPPDIDPPALRDVLFRTASVARAEGRFDRDAVLSEAAAALGTCAADLERDVYADLRSEQLLVDMRDLSPLRLVHRYNVALVQSLLRDAKSLTVTVKDRPARLRQLLASLKFHRLLYAASGDLRGGMTLEVEGPMSLFGSTRQYGLQLAMFLPSVLLCRSFELTATVRWKKRRNAELIVTGEHRLVSHYPDRGTWMPDEVAAFPGRFDSLDCGWSVGEADTLFNLGGEGVAVPDLRFDPPGGGDPVYLEMLGYWRRSSANRQLGRLARHGPPRYIVAVSDGLCVDETVGALGSAGVTVMTFKNVMIPRTVRKLLRAFE